jgi:hypothetical protein
VSLSRQRSNDSLPAIALIWSGAPSDDRGADMVCPASQARRRHGLIGPAGQMAAPAAPT